MKSITKAILMPFAFISGLMVFAFTRRTPELSYAGFRHLFVLTNGYSNDFISAFISIIHPKKRTKPVKSVLGDLDEDKIKEIVKDIDENGLTIFDVKLSEQQIKELEEFARTTKCQYLDYKSKNFKFSDEEILFDESNTQSPRFQFRTEQIVSNPTAQSICFDDGIREIANYYLNTEPILVLVSMWWSLPFSEEGKDRAAQMYHFDMDRIKFLKFFFYLTDVEPETGPHCVVKKSHKRIPASIRKDRRITDEEVAQTYPKEDIVEICGKKGSIIAVDTRGLHKGKILTKGKRLLFQLQFSNSLFGQEYPVANDIKLTPELREKRKTYSRAYQLINE